MSQVHNSMAIINANIYTPEGIIHRGVMVIKDGMIARISAEGAAVEPDTTTIDAEGRLLLPGFVDVHVHGGGGYDMMKAAEDKVSLDGMSRFHAAHGTTSFLATTLTSNDKVLKAALQAAAEQIEQGMTGAEAIGIHLEGPFLSPKRCGAQNPLHMQTPRLEAVTAYLEAAKGHIRLLTIAPELEHAGEAIPYLASEGVTVSIGHSDAGYRHVAEAVQRGASHVTHLFNGMSPLHHREPGVAGSALMLDQLTVELICDGIHSTPEIIEYVFRTKPASTVVCITDAIVAAGCPDGEGYFLGDLPIRVSDGRAELMEGGNLAGSTLTMDAALRNVLTWTGKPLEQVLPAFTSNPARQAGCADRKGSLQVGMDADFVLLSADHYVQSTYVRGRCVYSAQLG
ncbi:N-acetylglucosamine-6-phosphate deacetylase [Paenibacillus sp. GCM10023252]|uniref:N-acetylglucosamine-6-phosphate deacetylase n=1 Tax=Paenibacillus sp. GCM10023252 TaxID=3252649 RepID=UPI00360C7930